MHAARFVPTDETMLIIYRIGSGAIGLVTLIGTVMFALNLLGMEIGPGVILAGYMLIGGILIGALLLFFAITGKWRPKPSDREAER